MITREVVTAALLTDVAVRVTSRSKPAGVGGAVYVVGPPLAVLVDETVPQGAAEHDNVQVTPPFAGSLTIVAVNCFDVPPGIEVLSPGMMVIAIPPATVTFVAAVTAVLLTDAAVILTARSAGGRVAGAV
jgi:hypothetical protein